MVNGWINKPLSDLFDFSGGLTASRADLSTTGYPYLHYGDIHGSTRTFVDVCADGSIPRIDVKLNKVSSASLLNDGDVVFVDASEDDEGASRHVVIRNTEEVPFISGLHTIVAKAKTDELDRKFREFCFQSIAVKSQFKFYAVGTKVTGVSKASIGKIVLEYPKSKVEQHRIAEALSDMDALLAALEKLIAKKRAIKQGTMQELLTGKRRVPGFKGAWVERSIDYFGVFTSGNGFPLVYQGEKAGRYPFYKVSDFSNVGNERIMLRANNYISTSVVASLNCKIIPASSIIFAKIGAAIFLERKRQNKIDCCIDNNMMAFSANSIGDSTYLMYLFQTIKFGDLVTSTALPSLSSKHVGAINKLFPPTKSEQTAIAEILSDMDAEIDALTAKLNKLRNIKQGMMSELLTGRIRLPEQEAENVPAAGAVPNTVEVPKSKPEPSAAPVNGHNQHFDDAVMIAGIVDALYSDKFLLGRKKVQKCLYLLRRHQDESTAVFKKKAAGPYADVVRYKGGEPIARSANYVTTTTNDKGTTFARGSDIDEALAYIQSWGKQGDIAWVADKLKYKKGDELELLATVDMAICDLTDAGIPVSVDSIKHLIATNKEWKAKLKKQTFSDENIAYAIRELQTLL